MRGAGARPPPGVIQCNDVTLCPPDFAPVCRVPLHQKSSHNTQRGRSAGAGGLLLMLCCRGAGTQHYSLCPRWFSRARWRGPARGTEHLLFVDIVVVLAVAIANELLDFLDVGAHANLPM